jgi:hypothetical protein
MIKSVDNDDLVAIIDVVSLKFLLGTLTREWHFFRGAMTAHGGQHDFLLLYLKGCLLFFYWTQN